MDFHMIVSKEIFSDWQALTVCLCPVCHSTVCVTGSVSLAAKAHTEKQHVFFCHPDMKLNFVWNRVDRDVA